MCVGCTGKRKAQSDIALVKETPPAVQSPEVTDDTLAVEEPDTETSTDTPPQPVAMVLEPVVRDIPSGLPLSADSLSMRTEYDYYPVATSKVKSSLPVVRTGSMTVEKGTVWYITMKH